VRFPLIVLAAALILSACGQPPVNRSAESPPPVAASVELPAYLGLWYEIARFPNRFEDHCQAVTAEYARRDDGLLSVVNACRKGALDGEIDRAEGRARIVEGSNNAKLKVSFFGPFWADYWVLDRAEDYSWSLVGEPEGRYLWILARTPQIDDALLQDLLSRLEGMGYNTDALYFTPQPDMAPDAEPEAESGTDPA